MNFEQLGSPFVFSSPELQAPEHRVLHECPVGRVLREAPSIYEFIDACAAGENLNTRELRQMPLYFQHGYRLYKSEMVRLEGMLIDKRRKAQEADSDASYGKRARNG